MRRRWLALLICSGSLSALGCSYTIPVVPKYVAEAVGNTPMPYQSDRPIVLVVPPARALEMREQDPSSVTGGGATWTIPIGRLLVDTAAAYFERLSGRPVTIVPEPPATVGRSAYTLEPVVSRFDWELNQAKNVGFAITPQAEVSLDVQSLGDDTSGIATHCDSSRIDGPSYAIATMGGVKNRVSQTITEAFMQCLDQIGRSIPKRTSEPAEPDATSSGAAATHTPEHNAESAEHQKLIELKDLRDRGIITEEEYETKRQRYLEAL